MLAYTPHSLVAGKPLVDDGSSIHRAQLWRHLSLFPLRSLISSAQIAQGFRIDVISFAARLHSENQSLCRVSPRRARYFLCERKYPKKHARFLAARTTHGSLRYSAPAGAFVTAHPCAVTKGFGIVPRPSTALRAVNPAYATLLGSSDGGNDKGTLRATATQTTVIPA